MKLLANLLIAAGLVAVVGSVAHAYETRVCTEAAVNSGHCPVDARTWEEFQEKEDAKGLAACGIDPGERIIHVVSPAGKTLGYLCEWRSI